ncbi:hypothetical protein D6T64_21605 [Cryobacterium melibiosiphilum]|uniref:Uncharacterized protein n=1 Tax=Cryobacterium melibiosiphilum TaxID=995039 RepID=A0A3A5MA81_9MICO|nr:hypothetical protein [Cryobacterium melibiosiphilum]RJT84743.1 hypothetical protein D6T64_21605 [Cryobacterium melibiosiphilum]
MSTLSRKFRTGLGRRIRLLREQSEAGLQTVEWIFLVVGILVIAGIVIAAVTTFVDGQVALLPGT